MNFYLKWMSKPINVHCSGEIANENINNTNAAIYFSKLTYEDKKATIEEYTRIRIKKDKKNKESILDISQESLNKADEIENKSLYYKEYIEKALEKDYEVDPVEVRKQIEITRKKLSLEYKNRNYHNQLYKTFCKLWYGDSETSYVKLLRNVDKLLCSKGQGIEYSKYSAIIKEMANDKDGKLFRYTDQELLEYITKDINHFVAFLFIFVEILNGNKSKHFTNIKRNDFKKSKLLKGMVRINPFHNVSYSKSVIVDNLHEISEEFFGFHLDTLYVNKILKEIKLSVKNIYVNTYIKDNGLRDFGANKYTSNLCVGEIKLDYWEEIYTYLTTNNMNNVKITEHLYYKIKNAINGANKNHFFNLYPLLSDIQEKINDIDFTKVIGLILKIYCSIRSIQKILSIKESDIFNCSNLLSNISSEIRDRIIQNGQENQPNNLLTSVLSCSNHDNLIFSVFYTTVNQVILHSLDGLQKDIKCLNDHIEDIKKSAVCKLRAHYSKGKIDQVKYVFNREFAIHNQFNKISDMIDSYKGQYNNWDNQLSKQLHVSPKEQFNNINISNKTKVLGFLGSGCGVVATMLGIKKEKKKSIPNRADNITQGVPVADQGNLNNVPMGRPVGKNVHVNNDVPVGVPVDNVPVGAPVGNVPVGVPVNDYLPVDVPVDEQGD